MSINTASAVNSTHVPDVIDGVVGSLQHAVERIDSVGYRISRIADRIVGPTPQPVATPGTSANNPTVESLISDLGRNIERLFTELSRLESK